MNPVRGKKKIYIYFLFSFITNCVLFLDITMKAIIEAKSKLNAAKKNAIIS